MPHDTSLVTTVAAAFGVGLHFSLGDLMEVQRSALPGAEVQMGMAMALGMVLAWYWGWHWDSSWGTAASGVADRAAHHSEDESQLLRKEGFGTVFHGEEELAKGITEHVSQRFEPRPVVATGARDRA